MRSLLLASLLLLVISQAVGQTVYPYLQAPTPTSMVITWKTASSLQSLVEFGTSPQALNSIANGATDIYSDNGYPNNYYYHSVKLSNLQPNTKYYYKVTSGSYLSTVHSFRTLPLPGNATTPDGHLRFLIMGDNQIKAQPRFDSLMTGAKRKCEQLYPGDVNDNITMLYMVGDQVDVGTLDHYEWVHFNKSRYLSPVLPIQTTVGNHETYGTLQMGAYRSHFFYDSLSYQGIYSGSEDYYAQQVGRVLFISMSTEHVSNAQYLWVTQVVNAANNDPTVDWIVTLAHRPYQAEQYVGDISPWIRNTVMPFLQTSPKFVMHFGAHHHLYARGQLREAPAYHLISGGTAWDQYWNMSIEQDFDDVQKTISQWAYQIVDFDINAGRMDVEVYSIGSIYQWKDNVLIDEFHRTLDLTPPATPTIANVFPDSLELPYTLNSTAFSSPVGELLNTTQFQIAQTADFTTMESDVLRDYENLFGDAGAPDTTADLNLGVNILDLEIPQNAIVNGWHYLRVRHRDRNLQWSAWSAVDSFKVFNSIVGNPTITLDQNEYELTDTIRVTYVNGPGNPTDWIGLYHKGETPGQVGSTTWDYTSGSSGVREFQLTQADEYFAAFFELDGYTEIAPRQNFYAGPIPVLSTDTTNYAEGVVVPINFSNAPGFAQDWIGVYRIGHTPSVEPSTGWQYINGNNGVANISGLPKGYYFAAYFLRGQYTEAGERIFFSVGDTISALTINKNIYNLGEYITAIWSDGPGNPKDWLGVFDSLDNPNIDPLLSYTYINGAPAGTKTLTDTLIPQQTGQYFVVLFTNDSYNEVSNRCYFTVVAAPIATEAVKPIDKEVHIYPNPTNDRTVIESDYPIEKIELINMQGQVVFQTRNFNDNQMAFINHDLPNGEYFIRIYARKMFTYKIIVQH